MRTQTQYGTVKSLRRLVKSAGANLVHSLSLDTAIGASRGMADSPLIICYHRVVRDFADAATRSMPSLLVSCGMFEQQLDWLSRHFDMVSLDDISDHKKTLTGRRQKPRAAITFDDGYADFYWNAFPILESKNIPSAVFVVTDLVGTSTLQTHDEIYLLLSNWMRETPPSMLADGSALLTRLKGILSEGNDVLNATRSVLNHFSDAEIQQLLPEIRNIVAIPAPTHNELESLDWSMLRSLSDNGVCIGSHTRSHALLPHHNHHKQQAELVCSRLHLERELGKPVKHLAYPDGQFDERTAIAARAAGYAQAYTICRHQSDAHPDFTVSRRVLWEHACTDQSGKFSPAILSCLINGVFDHRDRCTHDHRAP